MADTLVYKVSVAPAADKDVVERQLTVAINGLVIADASRVFPADAADLGVVSAKQGDVVMLVLVDVDDAGNRSEPATLEFEAKDTLPPPAPGAFGVTLVAEVEGDDIVIDPVPPPEEA